MTLDVRWLPQFSARPGTDVGIRQPCGRITAWKPGNGAFARCGEGSLNGRLNGSGPSRVAAVPADQLRGGVMVATVGEALAAWGAYDQDDPFPLFAEVRELGAVHAVTLADGHDAWLVGGYERGPRRAERPAAVQGHARGAGDGQRGRRRGPARPGVRPAHAHRRPARSHPAAPSGVGRVLRPPDRGAAAPRAGDRRRPARRHRRPGTGQPGRPRRRLRFPAAVHRHLRAARRARAGPGAARPGPDRAARAHYRRPPSTRGPRRRPTRSWRCWQHSSRPSRQPRRRPRERADQRARRRRAPRPPKSCSRRSSS